VAAVAVSAAVALVVEEVEALVVAAVPSAVAQVSVAQAAKVQHPGNG
jgi:hypothetical protein